MEGGRIVQTCSDIMAFTQTSKVQEEEAAIPTDSPINDLVGKLKHSQILC